MSKFVYIVWEDNNEPWEDHARHIDKVFLDQDKAVNYKGMRELQRLCRLTFHKYMGHFFEVDETPHITLSEMLWELDYGAEYVEIPYSVLQMVEVSE